MSESKDALLEDVEQLIVQPDIPQPEKMKPSAADMKGTVTSYSKDAMRQNQLNNEIEGEKAVQNAEVIAGKGSQDKGNAEGIFKHGYFRMRPAANKQITIKIEEGVKDGKKRLWKQKTAIFRKGITYHFTNKFHCANLRANPNILEVFPGNKS